MGKDLDITAYGIPIAPFTSFKYLGRFLSAVDNLRRARQNWVSLTRVLRREIVDARTLGNIYFAVVHLVMLYG